MLVDMRNKIYLTTKIMQKKFNGPRFYLILYSYTFELVTCCLRELLTTGPINTNLLNYRPRYGAIRILLNPNQMETGTGIPPPSMKHINYKKKIPRRSRTSEPKRTQTHGEKMETGTDLPPAWTKQINPRRSRKHDEEGAENLGKGRLGGSSRTRFLYCGDGEEDRPEKRN
jgi:hypothetical protein